MPDFHEEEQLGKAYDSRLMRRLLTYAQPYWKWFVLSFVFLVGITAVDLARPLFLQVAIDEHINGDRDLGAIRQLGLFFLAVLVVGSALQYAQTYLLNMLGQRIIFNMRQQIFEHLQRLPLRFFDRTPVGRLVTRTMNDTERLSDMFTEVLVNLFQDVFLLVGIAGAMFLLDVRLALISLATLPFIALATVIFRIYVRDAYRQTRVKLARINAFLAENIAGMRVAQMFVQEARQFRAFSRINGDHYRASRRELLVFAIFRPSMEVFSTLALSLLLWYGGGDVIRGAVSFGVLYAFINYIQQFFEPINQLTEKYNILQAAMASSERIFLLLDEEEEVEDVPDARPLPDVKGAVEFENVWFAYRGDDWVLKDISFKVDPGETVALVGATGAGKSSIINILTRLYEIQRGTIRVDGIDARQIQKAELRRRIAVVLQDVFLFTGDIQGNIRLNNEAITDEQVRDAARQVHAERFIHALPKGYSQPVTERGSTLAAGQRQLLAFARALAFDPAILILDEATASIDSETERLIQSALSRLIAGRTTLIVAHRLSTIRNADRIIVLHRGEIQEMGNHEELMARRGMYHRLYQLQFRAEAAS